MSAQLRPRPDREPSVVVLLTLRVALIQPVIRPQAGRSEATEPKPRFVLLMRNAVYTARDLDPPGHPPPGWPLGGRRAEITGCFSYARKAGVK